MPVTHPEPTHRTKVLLTVAAVVWLAFLLVVQLGRVA